MEYTYQVWYTAHSDLYHYEIRERARYIGSGITHSLEEAKEQAELQRKQALWQQEETRQAIVQALLEVVAVFIVLAYLGVLMWAIQQHRENQLSLPWDL